jgi:DNA-binding IclR family transcriptional regulator
MDSGSTYRAIKVIDFLAAHSTDSFTLSQISSEVGLSHGSAHRIMASLTAARYVTRHPQHRTYSLGVALVGIGQAALERHCNIDIARREMIRVSEELNVQCSASVVIEDELLILSKHGTPQSPPGVSRVGDRRPFLPPIGIANVAWCEPEVVQAYLANAPSDLAPEVQHRLHTAIRLVRERGYSVVAGGTTIAELGQIASVQREQKDPVYWGQVHDLIRRLTPDEVQLVNLADAWGTGVGYITAPVFSPKGEVALELAIAGLPRNLSPEEIECYAARLRAAASVVMSETQGRIPTSKNSIGQLTPS